MVKKKPVKKFKKTKLKKKKFFAKVTKTRGETSLLRGKPPFLAGPIHRVKIKVIGIGGGGSSIISEIASEITPFARKKISFLAANTDWKALKNLPRGIYSFQFGQNLTHGLGTGMKVELGEEAAKSEKEKIKKVLQDQDLCIFISSLGGGTGSGAAPIFTRISRRLNNLTLGVFTLPFKFEGLKKMEIAKKSLEKLKPNLNAIIIIPNERIFQIIDKKTPIKEALSAVNKNLIESLKGLTEIIYLPGIINLDFADLRTILEGRGKLSYLNTVEISGLNKAEEAIKKLINSPLYPYTIKGAKGILFNITGGKNLSLGEISKISQTISELVKGKAKIIFGISQNKEFEDKIKITLLATGCRFPISHSLAKKPKKPKKKLEKKLLSKEKKIKILPAKTEVGAKKSEKEYPSKIQTSSTASQKEKIKPPQEKKVKIKVIPRRNALQVKGMTKKEEEEILNREKFWEIPAFLRKKFNKPSSRTSN